MSLAKLLGIKTPKVVSEEKTKKPKIDLFAFVKAIQHSKEQLIVDDWSERQYNPFMVNRALSFNAETCIQANEMNSRPHLSKKMQNSFLLNTIRAKKRFDSWIKKEKDNDLDMIKQYYGYGNAEAVSAMRVLTPEQLKLIGEKLNKGGI